MTVFSILLSLALVLCSSYLFIRIRHNYRYWKNLGIPCEDPHPIYGCLVGCGTKRSLTEIWSQYYAKFKGTGPFAGIYVGCKPSVFVLEPSLAKHIFIKEFKSFPSRGLYCNEKADPLTGNLFLLNYHKWKPMRQKLTTAFSSAKLKYMLPTMIDVGSNLMDVCNDIVSKSSIIDVRDLMTKYTIDVLGTCAFGIDCNSLNDPDSEFLKMGRRFTSNVQLETIGFAHCFPNLARRLGTKVVPDDVGKFFIGIVQETMIFRGKSNIRRNDFLDQLIDLKISIEEMVAQLGLFVFAGFEPTSIAMMFVLYELSRNTDIQDRVRRECLEVLNRHNGEFTYECMKELVYLDQVISEIYRLHTVLSVLNRECVEDFVVPNYPNYVIKAGMQVLIPSAAMHRDPTLYPEPDRFNPDNFSPERVKARDSVEWTAFGNGPRNCIGMRFAQIVVRLGLTLILSKFKFSLCDKTQIKYDIGSISNTPKGCIYLKMERL